MDKAAKEYMAALRADIDASYVWFKVGSVSLRLGEIERAAWAFSKAIEKPDAPIKWMRQAAAVQSMAGRSDLALKTHLAVLGRRPGDEQSSLVAARILLGLGKADTTVLALNGMRPSLSETRTRSLEKARMLLAAGRPDLACGLCDSLDNHRDADVAYVCGQSFAAKGDHDQAIQMFLKSADLADCRIRLLEGCFEALIGLRRADEAIGVARLAQACGDQEIDWDSKTALSLVALGRIEEAEEKLETILRRNPEDGWALDLLASLSYSSGMHGRALSLLTRAIELMPNRPRLRIRLAGMLADQGRDAESVRLLSSTYHEMPDSSVALALMSAWLESGFPERALELEWQGKPIGSQAAIFQRAASWERLACISRSKEQFEALLTEDSGNPVVCNYLGYMLAERGMEIERAVQLIRCALEAEPENPYYLDSLGWAFFKQGRPLEALPVLGRALEVGGEEPEILKHAGMVLIELGELNRALSMLERSLEGASWDAVLRIRIEELLEEQKSSAPTEGVGIAP